MVKKIFNKKAQRNRFLTPVGMLFMANIRTMNRSILLVKITYGNNKQIHERWEFQWHDHIVKINLNNILIIFVPFCLRYTLSDHITEWSHTTGETHSSYSETTQHV